MLPMQVYVARCVGAGVAGHHLAGRDADADADLRLLGSDPLVVEQLRPVRSSPALRAPRARSGRASGSGAPKMAISPSPDHQADDPAVAADRVEHQRVVRVEKLDRLLGRLRLDQRA